MLLGYDDLDGYLANDGYLGACVGRYANRIGGAGFELGGREYHTTANEGRNTLHAALLQQNGKCGPAEERLFLQMRQRGKIGGVVLCGGAYVSVEQPQPDHFADALGVICQQRFFQLVPHPLRRQRGGQGRAGRDAGVGADINGKAQPRRETQRPEHPQRVLLKAHGGFAHAAHDAQTDILDPVEGVHRKPVRREGHGVHGAPHSGAGRIRRCRAARD